MTEKKISRRDAMKILGTAVGATALANLPSKWDKPDVLSGVIPAHAAQSGQVAAEHGTQTFLASADFIVPPGVTSLAVDAYGAQGGNHTIGELGGLGGRIEITIVVTPGETLTVSVGGRGADGSAGGAGGSNGGGSGAGPAVYYGGGGGGWSGVSRAGSMVVVAGGGGGGGNHLTPDYPYGGAGGGTTGGTGAGGVSYGDGGSGGDQSAGGSGGGTANVDEPGKDGSTGTGGPGGMSGGGGGGGGYFGGGGGGGDMVSGAGGGGGSSYPVGATHTQGYQSGAGQVILTW